MRQTILVTPPFVLKAGALRIACCLLAAGLLAGCNGDPEEKAPQCPVASLLPDAGLLTRYSERGTDLSDLVLTVRLQDIKGGCGALGAKHESAHAHAQMVVTRGPAAQGNTADFPYSAGVVRNGQILDKRDYVEHVVFPPNVNTVVVDGQEVGFDFPILKGVSGPSYRVYFFLRLSEAELARNRAGQ